jgi:hypothetical protein
LPFAQISAEAHVRLLANSKATAINDLSFTITPMLDGVSYPFMTKTLSGFSLKSLESFNSSIELSQFNLTTKPSSFKSKIKEEVTVDVMLTIPLFKSVRVKIIFLTKSWKDTFVAKFARITSFKFLPAGRNVNSFEKELKAGMIVPCFSESSDTVEVELGVVTNTG